MLFRSSESGEVIDIAACFFHMSAIAISVYFRRAVLTTAIRELPDEI